MSPEATARAYYRAVDAGEYDDLAALLAPAFVHERPDRTLSGRERFVRFTRDERPRTDTEHAVDAVYVPSTDDADGDGDGDRVTDVSHTDGGADTRTEVAVRGRLLDADGAVLFGFVDVFRFTADGDAVERLLTYTD